MEGEKDIIEDSRPRGGRYKKPGLIFFGLVLLTVTGYFLYIYAVSAVEKSLMETVNRELAPNAGLQYKKLEITLFPVRVALHQAELIHTSPFEDQATLKPADNIRQFKAGKIELGGLRVIPFLRGQGIHLAHIAVDGLIFEFIRASEGRLTDSSPFTKDLPVYISTVEINNASVGYYAGRREEKPANQINNLFLNIEGFSVSDYEAPLHSYFDHFSLKASSIFQKTGDGRYEVSTGAMELSSSEDFFRLEHLRINPLYSALELANETGYATDQYTIRAGLVTFEDFKVKELMEWRDISAKKIVLDSLHVEIKREKSFPRRPRDNRPLPNAMLKDLPYSIQVDSLVWSNGYLSYTEQFVSDGREGTIFFDEIDIRISDFQNLDHDVPVLAKAKARFLNTTTLELNGNFRLDTYSSHRLSGSLTSFDLKKINPPLEQLVFMRIREGYLDDMQFSFYANDDHSEGELTMVYRDLEVRFLDSNLEENRRSRVRSFLANQFRVRSQNSSESPRKGPIYFERDKERSVFNFWWKSVGTGMRESL